MALDQQTELSRDEIDALLGRHETGVLSLARGDEPYAIPISYGYDATDKRLYMRLVSTAESEKRRFVSPPSPARLVVYEERDDVYESVVAIGTLEAVPREALTADHIEQFGDAKRPLFEIWGEPKPDLDIDLYSLDPDELHGHRLFIDADEPPE